MADLSWRRTMTGLMAFNQARTGKPSCANSPSRGMARHERANGAERAPRHCRHSCRTVSSASWFSAAAARFENSSLSINCDRAHTAAPRTNGLSSCSKRSACTASASSFELPIAIRTLRIKRSRPMRLTGDFENNFRNAASSSPARAARSGARNSSRAASLISRPACANLFHGQTARQSSHP